MSWTRVLWLTFLWQPTLIMHGDDDLLVPFVNVKIIHHLIPHSKHYIFHDGHFGLGTSAQELVQIACIGYLAHPFQKMDRLPWQMRSF